MRGLKGSWSSTSAENIRERAAPNGVFSGAWRRSYKRLFSQILTGFPLESVKTRPQQCCPLACPYMATFPRPYIADRHNMWSTFQKASVFRESTTTRCQWLSDRRVCRTCVPRGPVSPLFELELNKSIPASHAFWILKCSWEELWHSTRGVSLCPQSIKAQVRHLELSVSMSSSPHLQPLPTPWMVLAYTVTFVHTCSLSYRFRVARLSLFSVCRVTCSVTMENMFAHMVLSHWVWSCLHLRGGEE